MFFLFMLVIIVGISIMIHTSKIQIEIADLKINTEMSKGKKINEESKIYIFLVLFKKIKLFKKDIKNINLKNIKFQNKDIDIKFLKNKDIQLNYRDILQNIEINKIDLYMQVGTQDAAVTAILTGIIAGILGVIIRKPKYEVIPIYSNKNFLKINLNCIISFYLMQYIYKLISNKIENLKKDSIKKRAEV